MDVQIVWVKAFSNTRGAKRCVTHNRRHHADEMFATLILAYAFSNIEVMTTRDDVYEYDFMYDRGLEDLDHHQPGGNGQRDNGVPYASAGLVWEKYGDKAINNIATKKGYSLNEQQIKQVKVIVDRELIQGVDAVDNKYRPRTYYNGFESMSISKAIALLNPTDSEDETEEETFYSIINFCNKIFYHMVGKALERAYYKDFVIEIFNKTPGEFLVFEKRIPWEEGIYEADKEGRITHVIFPAKQQQEGYRIQALGKFYNSSELKKPFPVKWRGLTTEKLKEITGVEDIVFCHKEGFLAGCKTLEGAIKLTQIVLAS